MYYRRKKSGMGFSFLVALGMLVTFLASGVLTFMLLGGFQVLGLGVPGIGSRAKTVPPGYVAPGQVAALKLAPPADTTEAAMRQYFTEAAAFAKQNGLNTILFEAKTGLTAWWRDDIFPAPAGVTAQDGTFGKLDPLTLLCEVLEGQELQLWLQIDPYSSEGYDPAARGSAAALAAGLGGAPFSPVDTGYNGLLAESLAGLPMHYSIAGIVLSGFSAGTTPTSEEKVDFVLQFEKLVTSLRDTIAQKGRPLALGLAFDPASGLLDAGFAQSLTGKGVVAYLLPQLAAGPGLRTQVNALGGVGLVASPAQGQELVLFTAAQSPAYSGSVWASWPGAEAGSLQRMQAVTATIDRPLPESFDIPRVLALTYPAQAQKISTEGVFIMGTSNPAQPLLMDGAEVTTRATNGSFGIYVTLAEGENRYAFTQGAESIELTVEKAPRGSGGTTGTGGGEGGGTDNTKRLPDGAAGDAIRINAALGTAYTAAGGINESFPTGAVFVPAGTVATTDGGSYQLKSGDYVPASFCEVVEGDGRAAFTGLSLQADDGGEWLVFEGSGTPAAYVAYGNEDGTLVLTFYDTTLAIPSVPTGRHLAGATVESLDDGRTVLTLQTQDLWGYSLEYADGGTKLYLISPPRLSDNAALPLEGVRIMLDPGHGQDQIGSPGLMWDRGPHEKDVNLKLAQAIAYRLRQLGAEVIMTREDDSFPTLYERLEAQTIHKPHFFLSVHHNAMEPTMDLNETKGVEAFYYHPYNTPASLRFAHNLLDYIAPATGRAPRKVDWNYFYVTRTTVCPSVLFEYGFMLCPTEYEDVTSDEGIWAAAFATADAIMATVPQ